MKHLPPRLLLLSILISAAMQYMFPVVQIIFFPASLIGLLFIIIGWVISMWSERAVEGQHTTMRCHEDPVALVTTGPFKYSRNPFYLGYFVITFGVAVMLGSIASLVGPLIFISVINGKTIPSEEMKMRQVFSSEYDEYRRRVRRWL